MRCTIKMCYEHKTQWQRRSLAGRKWLRWLPPEYCCGSGVVCELSAEQAIRSHDVLHPYPLPCLAFPLTSFLGGRGAIKVVNQTESFYLCRSVYDNKRVISALLVKRKEKHFTMRCTKFLGGNIVLPTCCLFTHSGPEASAAPPNLCTQSCSL